MLFMLEERVRAAGVHPLLSCSDIEELLKHFLPRRAVTPEEVSSYCQIWCTAPQAATLSF